MLCLIWQPFHRVFKAAAPEGFGPIAAERRTRVNFKVQVGAETVPFVPLQGNRLTCAHLLSCLYRCTAVMAVNGVYIVAVVNHDRVFRSE